MKNYPIKLFLLISLGVAQNSDINSVIRPSEKYNSELKNSNKNGQGTFIFPNGDTYIGNFKNGSFHGQGTLHVAGGERYEGEWQSGKKGGKGTYFYPYGNSYKKDKVLMRMQRGTLMLVNGKQVKWKEMAFTHSKVVIHIMGCF